MCDDVCNLMRFHCLREHVRRAMWVVQRLDDIYDVVPASGDAFAQRTALLAMV